MKYNLQTVGTKIMLDVEMQMLTVEDARKLCDALQHCIKLAVQARDESENTDSGVEEATK